MRGPDYYVARDGGRRDNKHCVGRTAPESTSWPRASGDPAAPRAGDPSRGSADQCPLKTALTPRMAITPALRLAPAGEMSC